MRNPDLRPSGARRAPLRLVSGSTPEGRGARDDVDLVRALRAGEAWAFTATWDRYARLVYGVLDRALGSRTDSEDLTQDVFVAVFQSIGRLREPSALRSFVYSCTVRRLRAHLRAKRVRRVISFFDPTKLPDVPVRPEDSEARETLDRFYRMLDSVPAEERTVYVLRHVESLTLEEVAALTGRSLATVKRRLARAAERLLALAQSDPELRAYFAGAEPRDEE